MPLTVVEIANRAFYGNTSLVNITISSNVVGIGEQALAFTNINAITLPKSLINLDLTAFEGCDNLKEIKVEELTIDTSDYVGYYYFNGRNANGLPSLKKIIFTPRTVNFSTGGCINYCTSLKEIELPSNGTTLLKDIYSLSYSYTFRSVIINSGETIPQYFFEGFNKLENIEFKEGVKEIKAYSLFGIEGLNVILPKSIENIRPFSMYKVNFYYLGNESEWENVKKGYTSSGSVYFYSKDNPNKDGNYWYYDSEGNIKIWNN